MNITAFLIKYGEIGVKGKNRYLFEDALVHQIKRVIHPLGEFVVRKENGRIFVEAQGEFDQAEIIAALQRVFGIVGICPVLIVENKDWENLTKEVVEFIETQYEKKNFTFKVAARRADKSYPMDSMTIGREMGAVILDHFSDLSVDVHNPQVQINIEVRKQVYVYSKILKGPGGMPLGTNGKAMLLLSGGIDSPVAGYMIAKRGVKIDAVYFHAPPYTSERAKQKVVDLAKKVAAYAGPVYLHIVNFTDMQLAIYEKCPHEELTIIMRRYMMRIAEELAKENHADALITGESIGQVASQTIKSLVATNEVCTMPVFRPLIGFDKQEIIDIAEKIDTFETSIQPFEDCCTIFVAKHPVTKPNVNMIQKSERNLDEVIEDLMKQTMNSVETIICRYEE